MQVIKTNSGYDLQNLTQEQYVTLANLVFDITTDPILFMQQGPLTKACLIELYEGIAHVNIKVLTWPN